MRKDITLPIEILRFAVVSIVFGVLLSPIAKAQITYDGVITETDWGTSYSTSAAGPGPGFGAGHEINAVYVQSTPDTLHFAIAGNVQASNRILMFIDSRAGGVSDGSFDRTNAPAGICCFNSGSTFDTGFNPDYCLVIGTFGGNYFFDLYRLMATPGGGTNNFLGAQTASFIGASPANNSTTQGFEIGIAKTSLGYFDGVDLRIFLAYISDGGFLSNQFLTPAGPSELNYGGDAVAFGSAAPDPILIPGGTLPAALAGFSAHSLPTGVRLHWAASLEQNLDFYSVERSADQELWTEIARIPAVNGASKRSEYQYDDGQASGTAFYRLRMTDLDGAVQFSTIVQAQRFDLAARLRVSQGSLLVSGLEAADTRITLMDARGATVLSEVVRGPEARLAIPAVAQGVYITRIESAGGVWVSRVLVN